MWQVCYLWFVARVNSVTVSCINCVSNIDKSCPKSFRYLKTMVPRQHPALRKETEFAIHNFGWILVYINLSTNECLQTVYYYLYWVAQVMHLW